MEEKKAENEVEMKREIKYLLESWLQTKNEAGPLRNQDVPVNIAGSHNSSIETPVDFEEGNHRTNNNSIMTNFNPMTALETYENNNFDIASMAMLRSSGQ